MTAPGEAPLANISVDVHGPSAIHNMPCAVCREEPAVLDLSRGVMEPCWRCQELGYMTPKVPRWANRMVRKWCRP